MDSDQDQEDVHSWDTDKVAAVVTELVNNEEAGKSFKGSEYILVISIIGF